MKDNRRKQRYIKNSFQKKVMILVFAAALIPAGVAALCLYYLIFNLMARQLGIPESVVYNLMPVAHKVITIVGIAIPVLILIIWEVALELSHRIVGPVYRLEKDLEERLRSGSKEPIRLREKDELKSLADKINKILQR
ncbi:MAG: hypothetical protein NTZ48_06370 [Candidatus Omnitrophica bacterium]|nr:hypothetical protein [Candidatus Omnitrophota bacterium]